MNDEQEFGPETKLDKIKRRIKASREAFRAQRDRERSDLEFQIPDLQWDPAAKAARAGGSVGGTAVAARPMLSISKLDQPIQLVLNQARQAKLGVNIHPVSEKANKEGAEVRQGLYRRIERDSNADQARLWAVDRAVKAGMGAYLVTEKWDEDSDPDLFYQEIVIERILYQDLVWFDPAAQKPDFSDGEYSAMGAYIPRETFKREFPDADMSKITEDEFADLAREDSDWFEGSGRDRKILVVTYFYKVHDFETIESEGKGKDKRTRKRDKVTIRCAKITASDILEDEEINGPYLPIIPVLGRELQPFGNERRWVGMVGPAKDGQKLYNFAASSLVERMAMEPKMPWVMAEGQEEGHETEWQQANIRNLPFVRYKPKSLGGELAPPPQRAQIDSSGMSLAMQALQEADQFIQATTSIYDPSLGRQNPRDKSGRAILALQSQSDAGTSHYLAAFADISVTYEARVVLGKMPFVYDSAGRVCRILTGEDKDKAVMLNKPFVLDEKGMPQAAPKDAKDATMYDLRDSGGYAISVSIGKSFQTRLQQASEEIGALLQAAPQLFPVIGDIYVKNLDIPDSDDMSKRIGKWIEMQVPGLIESENGQQPSPQQLQAQIQAMQQQGQQMGQQLQMAMKQIETEQAKQQAKIAEAQLKSQTDLQKVQMELAAQLQKAQMDNSARVLVARINSENDRENLKAEILEEHLATGLKVKADAIEGDKDRAHEDRMQNKEMAHDVGMAHINANTVKRVRENGQTQQEDPPVAE